MRMETILKKLSLTINHKFSSLRLTLKELQTLTIKSYYINSISVMSNEVLSLIIHRKA